MQWASIPKCNLNCVEVYLVPFMTNVKFVVRDVSGVGKPSVTAVAYYERVRRAVGLGLFLGGIVAIRARSTFLIDSGV